MCRTELLAIYVMKIVSLRVVFPEKLDETGEDLEKQNWYISGDGSVS